MCAKSYKHAGEKRAHIPSKEEAGYENENPKVKESGLRYRIPVNPVIHRGRDPELFWLDKYRHDERIRELLEQLAQIRVEPETKSLIEDLRSAIADPPQKAWEEMLDIDIRSLYRTEHIAPEILIKGLTTLVESERNNDQGDLFSVNDMFGNSLEKDELNKVSDYYTHSDGWSNRMILGDSQRVMTSLLEREGMAGQVQTIYIDPPYGISYSKNWQLKLNDRNVSDTKDKHITEEPEQIKAYRDTWEKGVHSYLSYLKERLLVARELLKEGGSCMIQISDENVHLVRNLLDEVFGSENFVVSIILQKKAYQDANSLAPVNDYILWYAKNKSELKYRPLFKVNKFDGDVGKYRKIESPDGNVYSTSDFTEKDILTYVNDGWNLLRDDYPLVSQNPPSEPQPFNFNGKEYEPTPGRHWSVKHPEGLKRLAELGRLRATEKRLYAISYWKDSPTVPVSNLWTKMKGAASLDYVVQTTEKALKRCILMTTDPGDLVLDPTCGSGTTAKVAEEWGRRWITIDTSRIALNIAKTRLMTATYPYFYLHSEVDVHRQKTDEGEIKKSIKYKPASKQVQDIRQGFVYEEAPHITLKQLANNEDPETEILYDQPFGDRKKMRVSGPFTVETLQNLNPVHPKDIEQEAREEEEAQQFEELVFEHLKSAGIKNGIKQEQAVFKQIDRLASTWLHAEGFYKTDDEEKKAYFYIGPKFGTVSNQAVNEAIKECRAKGDGNWLVILGFSFESEIENQTVTKSMGSFEVTKVRMADDLLQQGLLKKDKKAASFVTIGEPDINLSPFAGDGSDDDNNLYQVEVQGIDIYDPIKDQVKPRNAKDIAYWMVDDQYDGSNFVVRQIFFSGGDSDEFQSIEKGLEKLSKRNRTKKKVEHALGIKIDDEAFDRLYGLKSHPFKAEKGQKVAVRVVSQFGEEVTKALTV
jgi:adenine-specific DNA-methyltransferase